MKTRSNFAAHHQAQAKGILCSLLQMTIITPSPTDHPSLLEPQKKKRTPHMQNSIFLYEGKRRKIRVLSF